MFKKLFKNETVRQFFCWLGAQYILFVIACTRWTIIRGNIPAAFWDQNRPFVLSFWHGRLFLMQRCWRKGLPIHMLVSHHRDGRLIADASKHLGIGTIAGSTNRGGAQAMRVMLKHLKAGICVGLTPDGPRGPRMHASEGIVQVARLAGVPILPATFATTRGRNLGSWDRFLLAWPFGKGVIVWGQPIDVPRDADKPSLEAKRQELEDSLNAITAEADAWAGRTVIEPAPIEFGRIETGPIKPNTPASPDSGKGIR